MSIFIRQQDMTQVEADPEKLKFAAFQYETSAELLRTVFRDCATKCVPLDYGEGDLSKGERTCTDRCVAKFMQGYRIMGQLCQESGFNYTDLRHYEEVKRRLSKLGGEMLEAEARRR